MGECQKVVVVTFWAILGDESVRYFVSQQRPLGYEVSLTFAGGDPIIRTQDQRKGVYNVPNLITL